jgi:hypothetical protein
MSEQLPQGGFLKIGEFVWIDLGEKEVSVNPKYIGRVELEAPDGTFRPEWRVSFEMGGYMPVSYSTLRVSEAEARNLMFLLVGGEIQ